MTQVLVKGYINGNEKALEVLISTGTNQRIRALFTLSLDRDVSEDIFRHLY